MLKSPPHISTSLRREDYLPILSLFAVSWIRFISLPFSSLNTSNVHPLFVYSTVVTLRAPVGGGTTQLSLSFLFPAAHNVIWRESFFVGAKASYFHSVPLFFFYFLKQIHTSISSFCRLESPNTRHNNARAPHNL